MKFFTQNDQRVPVPVLSFDDAAKIILDDGHWRLSASPTRGWQDECFMISDGHHTIAVHCENKHKIGASILVFLRVADSVVVHAHEAKIETDKPDRDITAAIKTVLLHALVVNGEWQIEC